MDKIWNSSVFTFIFLKIIFEILFFTLYLHPHWRGGRVVDRGGLENRWLSQVRGFESLSLRNKRWKSADCKTNTQFYTQECKVGVFVLFKIIQPLHNKRVAILKESDEKRLIFIYPFSLIFQDFTSSWKYLLLYSNVRSGL